MGVHEHGAHTKADRLIAAVEALTVEVRKLSDLMSPSHTGGQDSSQPNIRLLSNEVILKDIRARGPISQALKSAS